MSDSKMYTEIKNRFKIRAYIFKTAQFAHLRKQSNSSFKENQIPSISTDLAPILRFCISIVSLDLPEIVLAHEISPPLFCEVKMGVSILSWNSIIN
jgi:hypothetical protein